jgi:3-hydroxyacyl-[acyl-carrier-protein] dehydratase
MLLNKFFNIIVIKKDENNTKFDVVIELNPQHPIYEGHFPDNPVVPGVCMQQMVKETLSFILKKDIILSKGDIIKFLNFIVPTANKKYSLHIHIKSNEANQIKTDSIISDEETIYFKYTAYFKITV